MSVAELKKYTFVAKYANWLEDKQRRETWKEAIDRNKNMMLRKYADKPDAFPYIEEAYEAVLRKEVLGSQRALQFAGEAVFKHNGRLYNCLSKDTEFITSQGVKKFIDFKDGDMVRVLSHTGKWQNAVVKQYGKQWLNEINLSRCENSFTVFATENHRWLTKDGETSELKVGDRLVKPVNIFKEFNYDSATAEERLYWCYGLVYGDGTLVKDENGVYKHSMIRLCGHDKKYASRFEEMGFSTTTSQSLDGDFMAFTGTYLKTCPNSEIDSPELIRAFVRGYLDADGTKNPNQNDNYFINIQSSEVDHIEFIRKCFPIAGVYIVSEDDLTGQVTNFGVRPYTISFRIVNGLDSIYAQYHRVTEIKEKVSYEDVWCLEVDEDKSFTLSNGVVTGNCTGSQIDRLRFFQECMYLLMCGCGTGFSVQKHHIEKLPYLLKGRNKGKKTFVIEDSIEGWSDAVGVLVSSYFQQNELFPDYNGYEVQFDDSLIRPAGSRLSSCSGKAPGPAPLMKALTQIQSILDGCIAKGLEKIRPIHAYDIVMYSSDAVISGGIRRSATLCMFSHDDEEMCKAKTGNWFNENPQRGRSNNSAVLVRNEITAEEFALVIKNTREFGEPGFIFVSNREQLFNPCVEINFWCYNRRGLSGWQGCNLSTINASKTKTREQFLLACKHAAIIGTLQAGFTSFPYLGKVSEEIFEEEALLGVSMTGIMENPHITLSPELQQEGAAEVVKWNKIIAELIGIKQAARTTCVKPEGSASCLLGTSSGIHPHHAKRYIRRVQANKMENIYQHFRKSNPLACEESVWSNNATDDVISFCIEVEDGAKLKNQVSAIELLRNVKLTQQNWVESGKNTSLCAHPDLSHNVSNTITVKPSEWGDVENFIFENRQFFCGISLLPLSGDKDFPQAPFTTIYLPHEVVSYYGDSALMASGLITEGLSLFEDNLWRASEAIMGVIKVKGESKRAYLKRCEEFAVKYLEGDMRRLTYLMKDVYNWKLWLDLTREYKNVDYTECLETENNVKPEEELSCSGGKCEL